MTARNFLDEVSLLVNVYFCLPIFPTFLKAVKLAQDEMADLMSLKGFLKIE